MQVEQAIQQRRSVRSYRAEEVPEEKLHKVLEAARLAPSGHNAQEWRFVVVRDRQKREQLAEAAGQSFIAEAPVVIAAVSLSPDRVMSCEVPSYAVDLAIAVDHMTLQAVELGLGTCWIGAFQQNEAKKVLNIPEPLKIAALLPLGFPADASREKTRKSFKEVVCFDRFK